MEGEIESYDLTNRSLADEISELENEEEIDAQLQALKARVGSQSGANS
jgi:hypothetical protein